MKSQKTGNSGLFFVAHQLSRRGWTVLPTVRNSRGADLYIVNESEHSIPIQSKAVAKRNPIPLTDVDSLRSAWWVITSHANSDAPKCYIMTLEEVKAAAHCGLSKDGKGTKSWWMQPLTYDKPEYLEAWHRLGDPNG